jgi:hypothetical protein
MITGTFNGWPVVALPASPVPSSIEFTANDIVASNISPFTGQQQVLDWQAGWLEASVMMPPMPEAQAKAWTAFFLQVRGQACVFPLGVPNPPGIVITPAGSPVVNGANQTGYSLLTRGWTASAANVLDPGDWFQVGSRLHQNLDAANADGSGDATLNIWPPLRESPADGTALVLSNPVGLWRLKSNDRKFSINIARIYGFQFEIREAI